jgi:RNase P/RNase MRP subunit p30
MFSQNNLLPAEKSISSPERKKNSTDFQNMDFLMQNKPFQLKKNLELDLNRLLFTVDQKAASLKLINDERKLFQENQKYLIYNIIELETKNEEQ